MLCYDEALPSLRKQTVFSPEGVQPIFNPEGVLQAGGGRRHSPSSERFAVMFPRGVPQAPEQGEPGRVQLGRQPATHSDGVPNLAPYSHWCRRAPREEDRKSGLLRSALWPQGRLAGASRRRKTLPTLREAVLPVSAEEGGPRRGGLGWADALLGSSRLRVTCLVWLPWPETFLGFGAALTPVILLTRKVKLPDNVHAVGISCTVWNFRNIPFVNQ